MFKDYLKFAIKAIKALNEQDELAIWRLYEKYHKASGEFVTFVVTRTHNGNKMRQLYTLSSGDIHDNRGFMSADLYSWEVVDGEICSLVEEDCFFDGDNNDEIVSDYCIEQLSNKTWYSPEEALTICKSIAPYQIIRK